MYIRIKRRFSQSPPTQSSSFCKKVKRQKGKRIKMCVFFSIFLFCCLFFFTHTEAQQSGQQQKIGLLYNFWLLLASYQNSVLFYVVLFSLNNLNILLFFFFCTLFLIFQANPHNFRFIYFFILVALNLHFSCVAALFALFCVHIYCAGDDRGSLRGIDSHLFILNYSVNLFVFCT